MWCTGLRIHDLTTCLVQLFIVGTCGAIGTSDLLACFVAGCALNWDGQFLAEAERRHDEVNSCIDVLLNFGGFMYVGTVLPWEQFHQPDTTGITVPRLLGLGILVLLFRRIPALLITYRAMPSAVKSWKEAIFMGYFGPIGVGAVYHLEHTRLLFHREDPHHKSFVDALCPGMWETIVFFLSRLSHMLTSACLAVVYFLVLVSIIVHGLSIPVLSAVYRYYGVRTITDDAVEIQRRSIYMPTPPNAFKGDHNTFVAYNRFFRPLASLSMLQLVHTRSRDDERITAAQVEEEGKGDEISVIQPVGWL